MRRTIVIGAIIALFVFVIAACGNKSADDTERQVTDRIQRRYSVNQPIPQAQGGSQLRQNLIEIERAQVTTTQTTSFMFSRGASGTGAPIFSCPAIGFPIPSTAQLSNPTKMDTAGGGRAATINQIEPNGVFTGDSQGTYVICVNAQGKGYAVYWEGDVLTFTGPASYNADTHRVELVGAPTVDFSTNK